MAAGQHPAGQLISAAAARTLAEFETGDASGVWYDWEKLDHVCDWCDSLELPDYGKPVELLPFQVWILSQLYARKLVGEDMPATRLLMIEAARGAAKTYLGAMILGYELATNPNRMQLDLGSTNAATSGRDAAKLVQEFAMQVGEPMLCRHGPGGPAVINTETRSEVLVIPPDPEKWHGRRSRIAFLDESAHVGKAVITRTITGCAKRPDGQCVTFSTPHHDREVPYYGIRDQLAGELTEGVSKLHEVGLFWCIDDDDPVDFTEELCLKANPGLGHTIHLRELRSNYESMVTRGSSATRSDFIRQHYARFNDEVSTLVDLDDWRACAGEVEIPKDSPVYIGIDLSRGAQHDSNRTDVCSITLGCTDASGVIHVSARHFLPEHRLEFWGTRSKLPLVEWAAAGNLILCPGRIIDPIMIEQEVRKACEEFSVVEVAFDIWTFPRDLLGTWEKELRLPIVPRGRAEFVVPATEGMIDKVRARKIRHDGDPVLERALKNCRVKNYQGGRRPDKDPARSMIDPAMSLIYMLASCFQHNGDRPSAYTGDRVSC